MSQPPKRWRLRDLLGQVVATAKEKRPPRSVTLMMLVTWGPLLVKVALAVHEHGHVFVIVHC